jgi:hypothetical protein
VERPGKGDQYPQRYSRNFLPLLGGFSDTTNAGLASGFAHSADGGLRREIWYRTGQILVYGITAFLIYSTILVPMTIVEAWFFHGGVPP